MKISLTQTGGIAGGITYLGPVDTKADVESGMLEALVMATDFFSLPGHVGSEAAADDRMRTVKVEDGETSNQVQFGELAAQVPDAIKDLFSATEKVGRDHGLNWGATGS